MATQKFRQKFPYIFIGATMIVDKEVPSANFPIWHNSSTFLQLLWLMTIHLSKQRQSWQRDMLYGHIGRIKIWGKLVIICIIMF